MSEPLKKIVHVEFVEFMELIGWIPIPFKSNQTPPADHIFMCRDKNYQIQTESYIKQNGKFKHVPNQTQSNSEPS